MVEVAAGILRKEGRILIARRAAWKSLAGRWEFPGGKIEKDETAAIALVRELKEEFNITARAGEHFTTVEHSYDTFEIRLISLFADYVSGSFQLTDHDEIVWAEIEELPGYDFTDADIPIVDALIKNKTVV